MSTTGCASHDACASTKYCAALARGSTAGSCTACADCARYGDAVDESCPEKCDSYSPNINTNSSVFYNDFAYWDVVAARAMLDEDKLPSGCKASAEVQSTTYGDAKIRTKSCTKGFSKTDASRWCDARQLTAVYPFAGCIMSESTNFCGTGVSSFCIAKSTFDCCPVEPGALAGGIIGVSLFVILLAYLILRKIYYRKVNKMRVAGLTLTAVSKFKFAHGKNQGGSAPQAEGPAAV